MCLTARERILMIRLMEKLEKHPTYAMLLGIEATEKAVNQNMGSDPMGPQAREAPLWFLEGRKENEDIHNHLVCSTLLDHR